MKESPGTYDCHGDTSPTHRCAMNGAPAPNYTPRHARPASFGYDLVGGEIQLHDQDGVHVAMREDGYPEPATHDKV